MSVLPIRLYGDPILKEKSHEVTKIDQQLKTLTKNMAQTMVKANGVGIAAVQVGILKKVIILDYDEDKFVAYVNPKIVYRSPKEEIDEEGCLCLPEIRVPIKRARKVVVQALDLDGRKLEIEADDLLARILQHEIDHLEGVTILERTSNAERKKAIREFLERQSS